MITIRIKKAKSCLIITMTDKAKIIFYHLLKPLTELNNVLPSEYIDWGHNEEYDTAVGTGECAVVVIDLVATLLTEAEEKLSYAEEALQADAFADSIYHSYSSFVNTAKALLLLKDINCNTQSGIINDFDKSYSADYLFTEIYHGLTEQAEMNFSALILQINKNEPAREFALTYQKQAKQFNTAARAYRLKEQAGITTPGIETE